MKNLERKYWLYAPGAKATMWEEFYNEGIMGLGWEKLGDLKNYKSKEEIVTKLQELENTISSKKNDATANYDFLNEISIGDIVISKKGRSDYLGYGIVTSDYFYNYNRENYKKCRKVDWKKKGIWAEKDSPIVLKTLTDITKYPDYVNKIKKLLDINEIPRTEMDLDPVTTRLKSNINRETIEKALQTIDNNPNLRKGRESIEYDLVYNKKRYPPILVISEANKILGGPELLLSDFGNSTSKAFAILQTHGFIIERKTMDFSEQLKRFLEQSETGELKTTDYIKSYDNLRVKVSFGQGNQAEITWIAFLEAGQTVQNGIYPVYLYFKNLKLLILAYGVSETKDPTINWRLPDLKMIDEYFIDQGLGKPRHYGNSFVFKVYNSPKSIDANDVNKNLKDIIEIYKQELAKHPIIEPVKFNHRSFKDSTDAANLLLDNDLVIRFISALLTKPFVILTGLSGSGKTKLAQAFSKWICESDDQVCLVPVGADWTNREPLLGFPSALEKDRYILPENGVLSLILEASKESNQDKPYFLILDEMNLSHVERYFADFLSAMESGDQIPLHSSLDKLMNDGEVPANIRIPKNLFIIGTVNIDETTYMFSPKVLDRASVIEFRVSHFEMNNYLTSSGNLDLNSLKGFGSPMAESFLKISQAKILTATYKPLISNSLMKFFSELKKVGAEFGYRSASEIMRFSTIVESIDQSWEPNMIIDASIMQKLLPKVHGSRRKLEPVLKTLALLCLKEDFINGNGFKIETILNSEEESVSKENISYPVSFEKIKRMYRRLIDNGFTSYAEA